MQTMITPPANASFCLVNIEDAIKVAGLEDELEAIDLSELVEQHMM